MENWYQDLYEMLLSALGQAVADELLPAVPLPGFHLKPCEAEEEGDYRSDLPLLAGEELGIAPESLFAIIRKLTDPALYGIARMDYREGWIILWEE